MRPNYCISVVLLLPHGVVGNTVTKCAMAEPTKARRRKQTGPKRWSTDAGIRRPPLGKKPPASGGLVTGPTTAASRRPSNNDARMKALFDSAMESIALGVATEQDHATALACTLLRVRDVDAQLVQAAVEASREAHRQRPQR